jgi:hypothetical protein
VHGHDVGALGHGPDGAQRRQLVAKVGEIEVVAGTTEVGAGVVPATASGRLFRDELGRLNTRLSLASERVLLVVAGRAIDVSSPRAAVPPATASHGDRRG